jgi:hypothetical protein
VNAVPAVAVPPAVVTEIDTVPALWDLVVAMIVDPVATVKVEADVVPNLTAVAPVKCEPVIVTAVVPLIVPVGGVEPVTVGAVMKV